MKEYSALFIIIAVLASLISVSGMALAIPVYDVVYVDDDGPVGGNYFQDLNSALDATVEDGVIYIAAGTYTLSGTLMVDRDMAFIGEGADLVTIDAAGLDWAFYVNDASLYIYGCTIEGAGTNVFVMWDDLGTHAAYLHNNVIRDAVNTDTGVQFTVIDTDGEIDIVGNEICDNFGYGVMLTVNGYSSEVYFNVFDNNIHDNDGAGISCLVTDADVESHIERNSIHGNGAMTNNTGIYYHIRGLLTYSPTFIADNSIYQNYGDGIEIKYTFSSIFSPCDGSVLVDGGNLGITGNTIDQNLGDGIDITVVSGSVVIIGQEPIIGDDSIIYAGTVVADNVISDNGGVGLSYDSPLSPFPFIVGDGPITPFLDYGLFVDKNIVANNLSGGLVCKIPSVGLFNNLVVGNNGLISGIFTQGSRCDIVHNTVRENSSGIYMETEYHYIFNNIIASNLGTGVEGMSPPGTDGVNGDSMYLCNDVWGNGCCPADNYYNFPEMTGIDGNISEDPLFVGPDNSHLQIGSPCVNTGWYGVYLFVQDDLEGTHRPLGGAYDMGCYETLSQNWTPHLTQPLATLNLARANAFWSCLKENLPDEMTSEESALVEELQGIMAQAVLLGNPIMTNGLMQQAQELMQQLDALLECGCS